MAINNRGGAEKLSIRPVPGAILWLLQCSFSAPPSQTLSCRLNLQQPGLGYLVHSGSNQLWADDGRPTASDPAPPPVALKWLPSTRDRGSPEMPKMYPSILLRLTFLLMLAPSIVAAQQTLSNVGVLTCSLVPDETKARPLSFGFKPTSRGAEGRYVGAIREGGVSLV